MTQKPYFGLLGVLICAKCNLRCKGCTSFSDYENDEIYDTDEIIKGLEFWSKKLDIGSVNITGGEPFLHPDLEQIIKSIRRYWPSAMIDLTTNGTYITKRPEILDLLQSIGHCVVKFSQHQPNKPYTAKTKKFILEKYNWRTCTFRPEWLETDNQFYMYISSEENFLNPLKGNYGSIKPHLNNPDKAFDFCCYGHSLTLHKTSLYKCYPLAILKKMLTDFNQQHDPDWQPFLGYKSLDMDHTDQELASFVQRAAASEKECAMCPSAEESPASRHKKRGQWSKPIFPLNLQTSIKNQ